MDLINVVFAAVTVVAIVVMLFGLHDIDTRLTRMEHRMEREGTQVSQLPTVETQAVQIAAPARQFKWREHV
ncbi:MAG: hypothetical protein JO202_00305 [Ktedonobacteraceae bacterium]|nr:hypothetical protein [Ktedonobacteraceae bacterium]